MAYNRKDHLYNRAKSEGYRSRAAYKLIELDQKFRFLRRGARVLDLGCWPGGWLQVAAEKVGSGGIVVGIDLAETEPLSSSNVHIVVGDAREDEILKRALQLAGGRFDAVISDMSPKHTGIKEVDQAGTAHCVELTAWVCGEVLKPGGTFLAKAFPSGDLDRSIPEIRGAFSKFQRTVLKSTRKTSKEFYLFGSGFSSPVGSDSEAQEAELA